MCNIAGWAQGTGDISHREQEDKGRSNWCPQSSEEELQRRQIQASLNIAQ